MRKFLAILLLLSCLGLYAEELNVLMIGNSFSVCVGTFLPKIVKSEAKHKLKLTSAYIGGCSLQKHAKNLQQAETDSNFKPYKITVWSSEKNAKPVKFNDSVNTLLKNNKYDIITIQQASPLSLDYLNYQPAADEVIAYIRKYNPQAEIVIQQTWAYRDNDPRISPPKMTWGFDRDEMHKRICAAYQKFAEATNFRIIPTGEAVNSAVKNASSVENSRKLFSDSIHLSKKGELLQALVWYGILFNEDVSAIKFTTKNIDNDEYAKLKIYAFNAIEKYKNWNLKQKKD